MEYKLIFWKYKTSKCFNDVKNNDYEKCKRSMMETLDGYL